MAVTISNFTIFLIVQCHYRRHILTRLACYSKCNANNENSAYTLNVSFKGL